MTTTILSTTGPVKARGRGLRGRIGTIGYHTTMLLFAACWLIPILWMLSLSLSDNLLLKADSRHLLPQGATLTNYLDVLGTGMTGRWFINSMVVSTTTTIVTVIICAMAGYAFAKLPFPGRMLVYALCLAGMMVPKEAMFVPLFTMFSDIGLHNSYPGLILPRLAFPLGVFIMTQFFSQVPREMEEAARVDGAGTWRIFISIMVPLARPSMIALATFAFVQSWNDYLWPLVSATKPEMFTVTTGLASLQGNFAQASELGALMARGVVGALPLLLLFIFFQRHLIRGISMSSGDK